MEAKGRVTHLVRKRPIPIANKLNCFCFQVEDVAVNPPAAAKVTSAASSPTQSPTTSPGTSPLASPVSSPPASPRASISEGEAPYVFLEGGALLAVATHVVERLLFLHERKVSILSTHDFVIVLSMLRQLFEVFQFTADTFKKMENARRLLYHLYELYFILFKPDKKEILNYVRLYSFPNSFRC